MPEYMQIISEVKKNQKVLKYCCYEEDINGRQEGIRTLEGLHPTRVPVVRLRPLGHLSTVVSTSPQMAAAHEKEGWAATFPS